MKLLELALVGAVAVLAVPSALAVPVTIDAGEQAFFNFDLTGASPGPVYDEIRIVTNVSGYDGDEVGAWNFYDLFAPPPNLFIGGAALDQTDEIVTNLAGVLDGVFSLQLVLLAGSGSSITVDPYVIGVVGGQETDLIPPVGVPEPGTLALLAAGFLGLSLRRKRAV